MTIINHLSIAIHSLQYEISLFGNGSKSIRVASTFFFITCRHILVKLETSPKRLIGFVKRTGNGGHNGGLCFT